MRPSIGVAYALAAAASYGLMSFLVHWNPAGHPVEQLLFWRSLFALFALLPFCLKHLGAFARRDSAALWSRSLFGAVAVVLYYYSLQGTTSANANLLYSGSPLFVCLIAWLLFRERLSSFEMAGMLLIVLGNFLLYWPNRGAIAPWVWPVGLGGAFFASLSFVSLGAAARRYHPTTVVFGFSAATLALVLVVPGKPWIVPLATDYTYLIIASALGLMAQLLATASFAHLKSSVATAFGRCAILFSSLLDVAIAHYRPHWMEWASYFVVLAGIALAQGPPHRLQKTQAK